MFLDVFIFYSNFVTFYIEKESKRQKGLKTSLPQRKLDVFRRFDLY